jgi:4-amino-4-deoxy-L-arabinose transferase-like glycosyltransferase
MLLAAAFAIFGVSWWTAVILNCVLGGMTVFFVYRIGERRLGARAGLIAAVWLCLSVHQIHFASFPLRDVFATLLLAWFVYALVTPFRRMRGALWLAFLYTLLIMTRPVFLVLLPVLLIYLARFATQHRELSMQYVFLFAVTLLFVNLPWTIRNYVVHGEFVPICIQAQTYTAPIERMLSRDEPIEPALPNSALVVRAPGFFHNTREFWRAVRLRDAPADPAHGLVAQPAWSVRHNLISLVNYGLLLPFFLAGAVFAVRKRHRTALILTGVILSYAIVRGFVGGDDRTRLIVEPQIILVSVYGLRELLKIRSANGA